MLPIILNSNTTQKCRRRRWKIMKDSFGWDVYWCLCIFVCIIVNIISRDCKDSPYFCSEILQKSSPGSFWASTSQLRHEKRALGHGHVGRKLLLKDATRRFKLAREVQMFTMDLRKQAFLNNLNIFDRCYGKSQKILLPEQQGSGSASIGCSPGVTAGLRFSRFSAFSLRRQAQGAVRRFARSANYTTWRDGLPTQEPGG